jgi:HPt (histidine-containing phosphotransfer) domain-containing protein
VVLMDIQMPGMDGTEALQVFRRNRHQRFNFLTRPDTPVVAVTAHALDGDDMRFASVGFDAYLSKPFRIHQLAKVLQTVAHLQPPDALPPDPSAQPQGLTPVSGKTQTLQPTPHMTTSSAQPTSWREVFDEIAVQRLLELDPAGRNALIDRIIKMFATSVDKYLVQLASARQAQDRRAIKDVAHTLKSSSANVGALKLSQICVEIENAIRDDNGLPLEPMIDRLEVEARYVVAALPLLLEASR